MLLKEAQLKDKMMGDLYKAPPTIPVSELRKHSDDVFNQLKQTHVLLTRQGSAAGVLVHPTVWNRVIDRLDELEAIVWALEAELKVAQGESEFLAVTDDMLEEWKHPTEEAITNGKIHTELAKKSPEEPRNVVPA